MFKVILKTQKNKEKINQHCLKSFVGCGWEQSEGPDFGSLHRPVYFAELYREQTFQVTVMSEADLGMSV